MCIWVWHNIYTHCHFNTCSNRLIIFHICTFGRRRMTTKKRVYSSTSKQLKAFLINLTTYWVKKHTTITIQTPTRGNIDRQWKSIRIPLRWRIASELRWKILWPVVSCVSQRVRFSLLTKFWFRVTESHMRVKYVVFFFDWKSLPTTQY